MYRGPRERVGPAWRGPAGRTARAGLTAAEAHRTGLLARQAGGFGLRRRLGRRAGAEQRDAVAQGPRLLEVERGGSRFHPGVKRREIVHGGNNEGARS